MTLSECFKALDGDYEGVIGRLLSEERVIRYLKKFEESTDYSELIKVIGEKKWEDGFRLSHNIKGVCSTLGLTRLFLTCDLVCESMRHGAPTGDISGFVDDFVSEYKKTVEIINQLD